MRFLCTRTGVLQVNRRETLIGEPDVPTPENLIFGLVVQSDDGIAGLDALARRLIIRVDLEFDVRTGESCHAGQIRVAGRDIGHIRILDDFKAVQEILFHADARRLQNPRRIILRSHKQQIGPQQNTPDDFQESHPKWRRSPIHRFSRKVRHRPAEFQKRGGREQRIRPACLANSGELLYLQL